MKFKKVLQIGNLGVTSMLCAYLEEYIFIYGGSNFPNGVPPVGMRALHNDMYLIDDKFNIILNKKGKIFPDRAIVLEYANKVYLISGFNNSKIYEYRLENSEIIEEEIFDLGFEIIGGFGAIYNNKIYFGKDKIYEFDLKSKKIIEKAKFIGPIREQSVFFSKDNNIYIISGASNIGHLDAYKYDINLDKFTQIKDAPTCLGGASAKVIDNENALIIGGFNKKIYDEAILNLSDIEYKKKYFSMKREEFNWNNKIYLYNFINDEYKIIGEDENAAKCGAGLLIKDNKIYIINGEYKPGYRDPNIYEGEF